MRKISLSKKDKNLSVKTKVILITAAAVLLAAGIAVFVFLNTYHIYETKIIKPTCETKGYTESTCIYCGEINRTHYTEALGHDYGEYVLQSKPSELEFGKKVKSCSRCSDTVTSYLEPTIEMKKFYYSGDAFKIDSDRVATGLLTYSYKGEKKDYYINLAYLDGSQSKYIKHDYSITFFNDKQQTEPVEVSFMDGVSPSHKWELYGNYYDYYNIRDAAASELYKQVRASSKVIDERLKDNYLDSKDEPVLFFMNESLVGVFRLTEPARAETMNVSKKDKNCAIVRAVYADSQAYLKAETSENGTWKIKYNSDEENTEWVYESMNELIRFVNENEGEDFKNGISKYLDVDGMIDYMLTLYNTAAADNITKGFTLATYDGKVWTPGLYDANYSFGMNTNGEISNLETVLAPSIEDGVIDPDCGSLLWERMFESFYDEIKVRYNQLKSTVFTPANVYSIFEKEKDKVPDYVYEAEKELYALVDTETDLKESLVSFMSERKNILEVFFEN